MKTSLALLLAGVLGYAAATEVICYWGSWSHYRKETGMVTMEDLDPHKCTIYIYSFATLNATTNKLDVFDPWLDISLKGYEKFVGMKQTNPALKTLLAIGGWNDSQGSKYSTLLANPTLRAAFVTAAVQFLEQYDFDGLDLDYEYPTAADKPHFAAWVTELKAALEPRGLMLTAAVSAKIDAGYDVPTLATALDFINVMAYDLHGSWEARADHHAPLEARSSDNGSGLDVQSVMAHWMSRGAPAAKLAMGVPLYGRSWTVSGADKTPPAPANGPGLAGTYTLERGSLSYLEICEKVNSGWTVVQDPTGKIGPYAYSGDQWVGYDDVDMVATKTQWAVSQGFGAVMVWDVSSEDIRNTCGGGSWPLISAIQANLVPTSTTTATSVGTTTTVPSTSTTPSTTTPPSTTTTPSTSTPPSTTTAATAPPSTTIASTTTPSTSRTTPSTSGTTPSTSGTTPSTSGTTSAPGGAFSCPVPYGLFPDPSDCQKFYQCSQGVPHHITCPDDLMFDPALLVCSWSSQVSCTATSGGSTRTSTTTTTTTTQTSGQFMCPLPIGWFADPDDCHSYYNCFNNTAYHFTCPAGTSWQQSITNCNWSSVTGC